MNTVILEEYNYLGNHQLCSLPNPLQPEDLSPSNLHACLVSRCNIALQTIQGTSLAWPHPGSAREGRGLITSAAAAAAALVAQNCLIVSRTPTKQLLMVSHVVISLTRL